MKFAASLFLVLLPFVDAATTCADMEAICTSDGATFAASTDITAETGNDYDCLGTQPNPAWYYLEISTAGEINTLLSGSNDVDFALWGPYSSKSDAVSACGSLPTPVDCSYSSSVTETPTIPSTSSVGDIYVVMFTNYANVEQDVSFTKTGGAGDTNCGIVSAAGDPHFKSGHGDRFDFKGKDKTIYSLLSTEKLGINAFFEHVDYRELGGPNKRFVQGSYMTAAYAKMRTSTGHDLTVEFDATRAVWIQIGIDGAKPTAYKAPFSMSLDDVRISLANRTTLISIPEWAVNFTSRFKYGIARGTSCSDGKCFVDVKIRPRADMDHAKVAPHGLIGQSFDGDDIFVIGKEDEYKGKNVTTAAMGEGAIEGVAADYEVASKFATDFKYSRWGMRSAAPRDVAALTGRKFPRHSVHKEPVATEAA